MKLLILLCFNLVNTNTESIFNNYLNHYEKHYNSSEYDYRYSIFKKNYNYINQHNLNSTQYILGINNFTDFSRDEFKTQYLNLKYQPKSNLNYRHINGKRPISIDWRAAGMVTNVKNQGACGSCWAFSAVGTMEGQHAKTSGKLVSLSEQNLVDCSTENFGCNGGWPNKAMEYVKQNGIDTEDTYPYNGTDQTCQFNNNTIGARVKSVVDIPSGNMSALYDAIGLVGPISVAIDAENDFQFYKAGIYSSTICSNSSLDHAVLAVGYSEYKDTPFIIIKNSWGADWGMDGYIYFSTKINNMCGIATDASYPIE